MNKHTESQQSYAGFELGPIRPPSEAASLMLRVTRNCPWNKCKFCGLYRGETFSIRPVEHVMRDIDRISSFVDRIEAAMQQPGEAGRRQLAALQSGLSYPDEMAFISALNWVRNGMRSVFLQDANTLVVKPADLIAILEHLRRAFPRIERVTSYARSHSIARIGEDQMARLAAAGLNRIHIGMESGADAVLEFVRKGVNRETQIVAGQKVKRAGIELSEYFMPGLGGAEYSSVNALQTADAINQIDPDFIRIRTLAVPANVDLYRDQQSGAFTPLNDLQVAAELLLFLDNLEGITSVVRSDHILNLFQEVEGRLPHDRERMTQPIRTFLALEPEQQLLYLVGRRTGIFTCLADLDDAQLRRHAEHALLAHRVTTENVAAWTAKIMQGFV
ncbi:MAG: radical SAM protein [Desulfuromonadales bacterium]